MNAGVVTAMSERVRIVLEVTMDEERWVQDALAIRMAGHLVAEAEEHGVDLTASYVSVTSAGGPTSRSAVAELVQPERGTDG